MYDAQGHLRDTTYQEFANYCVNLVKYYNEGGFDANGKHFQSSRSTPITWWGIVNEPNINGLSPVEYVNLYNKVVPAMQAVDPTLKFVAVELADFSEEPQHYMPPFVSQATAQVDVIATHYYSSYNQKNNDQALFDSVSGFVDRVNFIHSTLRSNPALANVPVWVTENNVNADYDEGGGISACNGTPFVLDQRGTSAFFAAWRPLAFSKLAQASARALYHWDFDADAPFGEVDAGTDKLYLSYWVDYWLARYFPSPPGSDILQLNTTESQTAEILATRNDDGTVVVMVTNHAVHSPSDNNGPGDPRTVVVDLSALGSFTSATQLTIDSSTDPSKGPTLVTVTPGARMQVTLNGYGVSFLTLKP